MNKQIYIAVIVLFFWSFKSECQDSIPASHNSLLFKGQLSSWAHFNPDNPYPLYLGGRYIPQLNYEIQLPERKMFDFEVSANIYGDAGIHFFDSAYTDGDINPYRVWGRYSTKQLEVRLGLQKINFGPAIMMRALRWFDQVDPRDPLRLTEGVWGALGRYYFLNNANIWLWSLYGNKNPKGLEFIKTNANHPEFGGRFQTPVPKGEAAISYNHRVADSRDLDELVPVFNKIPENKIGIDAKLDMIVGLWFEGVWVNKSKNLGDYTNQEIMTAGVDYTFGIGSGLYVVLEHMLFTNDEKAFQFSNTLNFSGFSVRYPIGMFDNISAIFYYDWTNNSVYNFLNWYRQFDHTTLYVMGYWNPENPQMPAMGTARNLYGGKGVQVMFVYNH
ncbi:MAG: hypothetical protein J7K53_02100 [Bacteroidales bacterium]|nr:hypothetical protein [Bacteroidales bacterium]